MIENLPNMYKPMGVLPYTSERRKRGREKKRGKEWEVGKEREGGKKEGLVKEKNLM